MRRLVTALVPVMASVASLSLVACGNDGSTSDAGAAVDAVAVPTSAISSPATSSTGDAPVEAPSASVEAPSLLIDALPDISGPTVLWFWAPG